MVSKALKFPVLLDEVEMQNLFAYLEAQIGQFFIFPVDRPYSKEEEEIPKELFLKRYSSYVSLLRSGELPSAEFRSYFSPILTLSSDILYVILCPNGMRLIKAIRPVIQLQPNFLQYSEEDGEFRSMVFGKETIHWGIQFSYPQLFQDPHTQEIFPVRDQEGFPNTVLFKALQKWIRDHTRATPFLIGEKKMNVSVRLGKQCFSWINLHPQLVAKGILVGD